MNISQRRLKFVTNNQTLIFSPSTKIALLTIYKSFVRPHLDYGDIIYDNPENETLMNKLEKVQYQAYLQLQVLFKVHPVRAFTENWGLNVYNVGGGIEK